jgi:ABC-type branched-subunit amino acid transport system ATPase component
LPDAPALRLEAITQNYGPVEVLSGVDIDVREGSVVALLGTNGAGKTTALKVAAGLLRPSRGTVRLFGKNITSVSTEKRVAQGMAMVPGGRGTFPSLTVLESLRTGAYLFRHQRRRVEAALEDAFARFPILGDRRHQASGTLSGGEQQMLALARALMSEPKVLLVDELSLGLAPTVAADVLASVRRLADAGTTVLLVEQSVGRAVSVADHAYFLERGRVRFSGPAHELPSRTDLLRPVLLGQPAHERSVEGARTPPTDRS